MYQKMYSTLFNAITDALEQLERKNISSAEDIESGPVCGRGNLYILGSGVNSAAKKPSAGVSRPQARNIVEAVEKQ